MSREQKVQMQYKHITSFVTFHFFALPQHVVHAHNALGLGVATVVDDGTLGLHPHIAPILSQHPVLTAHRLAFGAH